MATRLNTRRWVSVLYLLLLSLVGGTLYFRLQTPPGKIFLSPGVTEHTIIIPHEPGQFAATPHRDLSADLLPLDNPRALRFLDGNRTYDGVVMDLGLRLDRSEILRQAADQHMLVIHGAGGEAIQTVIPGDTVSAAEAEFVVEGVTPWEGLVRHERGRPLAHIAWVADTQADALSLFLERDAWSFPDEFTAIQFQWHDSEAAAKREAQAGRDALQSEARWGVRDGAAIQWLQSLTRGSGLTLRDGTQVLFVGQEGDGSAITLQVTGETTTRVKVPRNAIDAPGPYYYQDPTGAPRVLRLHGWNEGQALLQWLDGTASPVNETLSEEGQWDGPQGAQLRLNQLMSHAVPLTHATGGLWALVLRHGEQRLQLREGVVVTSDAVRLEYRRKPQPPELALHLTALNAKGETIDVTALAPGASHRFGNWVVTWEGQHVGSGEDMVLSVRRYMGMWALALGFGLLFLGTFGLVYIQTRPRRV